MALREPFARRGGTFDRALAHSEPDSGNFHHPELDELRRRQHEELMALFSVHAHERLMLTHELLKERAAATTAADA